MTKYTNIPAKIISIRDHSLAGRIAAYIHTHAFDHPELLQYSLLSRQFGVSATSLKTAFKVRHGIPIHSFIIKTRHAMICELLAESNRSIKDIAYSAGYFDLSNFSRDFAKMAGVSPSVYKQQQNIHYPITNISTMSESS